jgi:predicted PurR-regulated permease PerM
MAGSFKASNSSVPEGDPGPSSSAGPFIRSSAPPASALLAVVLVGILLYLVSWAAPVLAPLGLGIFLAALAAPLFTWLEGRGLSSPVALTATIGLVLVVGGLIALLALASAQALTDGLATYTSDLQTRYADASGSLDSAGLPATIRELLPPETLAAALRSTIAIVIDLGTDLLFAVVVAALLLLDGPRLARLAGEGTGAGAPVIREAPSLARAAVTYFVVRIRVNAVTAAALLVLMLVIGVDDPLLWATGAFFLSFVPYLGLVLALIPPTILAFAESGLPAAVLMVVGGVALNLIAENVLEPTLTGRALQLATWLVFVMFFIWVWLIGPVGALLSMPITVLIVLILRHDERTAWLGTLVSREEGA